MHRDRYAYLLSKYAHNVHYRSTAFERQNISARPGQTIPEESRIEKSRREMIAVLLRKIQRIKKNLDTCITFRLNNAMKNYRPRHTIAKSFTGAAFALLTITTIAWPADLKSSFEKVCAQVDASQNLNTKEISSLIEQIDALRPEMEKSEDPAKKLYLQRIKKCRSVYEFVLESKKSEGK